MSRPDLIVVGGGIVGASVGYHAVSKGLRTLLIDARDPGRATDAGAGIVSPETNSRDPGPWRVLAREAAADYPRLSRELAESGESPDYAVVGLLIVATSPDETAGYDRYRAELLGRDDNALREVPLEEARERFPPLAPTLERALLDPGAARVDGRVFEQALLGAARKRGLEIEHARVRRVVVDAGRAHGVETDGAMRSGGAVLIAGGAWTPAISTPLGVHLPVEPQRGQIAHLELAGTDTSGWAMLAPLGDRYMVPWPDGRVAVGATRETGSGFDARPTAAGVHSVLGEALRVAPGLADATLREVRVGLRPLTRDGLPILGPVPGHDDLYVATGHGPTGLSLGPFSGRWLVELIRGEIDASVFAPYGAERAGL